MTTNMKIARRISGLARFERTTRRKASLTNRLAWKTPGTREAGEHAKYLRDYHAILNDRSKLSMLCEKQPVGTQATLTAKLHSYEQLDKKRQPSDRCA